MNVAELIAELSKLPQDCPVRIYEDGTGKDEEIHPPEVRDLPGDVAPLCYVTMRPNPPCEGCANHPESIPGVRYPTATNEDESRPWIERCDLCEVYEGDDEAAEALVAAGKIAGFRVGVPNHADPDYPSPYAVV